jgi:hypothetical protein
LLEEEVRAARETVELAISLAGPTVTHLNIVNFCDYADRCSKVMHSILCDSWHWFTLPLAFSALVCQVDTTEPTGAALNRGTGVVH